MATNILVSQSWYDVLHTILSNFELCYNIGNVLCSVIIVTFYTGSSAMISARQIGSILVAIFDMIQLTVSVAKLFSCMRYSLAAYWQNEISLTAILLQ